MRRFSLWFSSLLLVHAGLFHVVSLAAQPDVPSTIGLFFDTERTNCAANLQTGESLTAYVLFVRHGDFWFEGFTVGEFGIDGLPDGWLAVATPNPLASVSIGEPVATADAQATILFPDCQADPVVVLYEVQLFATTDEEDVRLKTAEVMRSSGTPCRPQIGCGCLSNCFVSICVGGTEAVINPSKGNCTIAVEQAAWGAVKSLYRW